MSDKVNPVPEGFNTVSPHLIIKGAGEAIEFYKKAFGAEELCRMPGPDGKSVMHAEVKIGDSTIMICEEFPQMEAISPTTLKGSPVSIHLYVEDADKLQARAVEAGATERLPVQDTFWGDRYGKVTDPFGHHWSIATHVEDVSPEECARRAEKMYGEREGCGESE